MSVTFELIWRIIWEENTPAGRIIVFWTVIIALVALMSALLHLRRYLWTESQELRKVSGRLHDALAARAVPPERAAKEPRSLIDLAKLSEGIPDRTLIGDRIATIRRIMRARVKVSVDALQQMTMLRESGRISLMLPSFVAGLCMLLGLLGTFLGLSILVRDLQGTMPAAGTEVSGRMWAESMKHFGAVFAGKRTAFSCTLVGLACSILLSALNFLLARVQSRFYDRLERFTIEELLPETVPSVEGETALERFALQMGESFERLDVLTSGQMETVTQVRAIESDFRKIVENVSQAAARSTDQVSQQSINESKAVQELTRVSHSVVALTEKLTAALAQTKQSDKQPWRELLAAFREQKGLLERVLTNLTDVRGNGGPMPGPPSPAWTPRSAVTVTAVVGVIVLILHLIW